MSHSKPPYEEHSQGRIITRVDMKLVNRTLLIVQPKQPFIEWINSLQDCPTKHVTLEFVRSIGPTTFLCPHFFESRKDLINDLKSSRMYDEVFSYMLFSWWVDDNAWPSKRTFKVFQEWFEIDVSLDLLDLVDSRVKRKKFLFNDFR